MPDGPPDPTATLTTMSTGVVLLGCVRGVESHLQFGRRALSVYWNFAKFCKINDFYEIDLKIYPRVADTPPF